MADFKDWLANLSVWKLLLLMFLGMLFFDMVFYYINAFFGRSTPPYPLLHEILDVIRSWKIDLTHVLPKVN